ncbi:hypothetical protein QBC34DRAFT_441859 [Podospora aff. communis PSN243]|uniref:Carbohydrate Esterase Family 3 n=1 Tax=Podospora aff. communis PSN243 TaxID=3040156 RepID=A0AAV9GBG9_9PEZI|nr:hypothetical protein QBC34DRAFT_441859 [Podospora aff. communis PSN243]
MWLSQSQTPGHRPWQSLFSLLVLILSFSRSVQAIPPLPRLNSTSTFLKARDDGTNPWLQKRIPDFHLRILPLGASIMWGFKSTHNNGFRKYLRDSLRQSGYKVNMVGSRQNGDMKDRDVEGTIGHKVHEILDASRNSVGFQPNVILINGGNNDARENYQMDGLEERMEALLDYLFGQVPNTTIILSTLTFCTNSAVNQKLDRINTIYRHIAYQRRYVRKQKLVLADMETPGTQFDRIGPADLDPDGIHPNNDGYKKMAAIWFQAILDADHEGFITAPNPSDRLPNGDDGSSQNNTCDKKYGQSRGPIKTQAGSGQDDGIYRHSSANRGVRATITTTASSNPFTFARLTRGSDRHDLLQAMAPHPQRGGRIYLQYKQTGPGEWDTANPKELWIPDGCLVRGVRWEDANADGLDDMFCVAQNGDVFLTENVVLGQEYMGEIDAEARWHGKWKSNEGYAQDRVHITDIDGDGRADYCVVENSGDVRCWRNGGTGIMPEYWQPLGVVFTGKGMGDPNAVRFADLNGDGRPDWLWMDPTGQTWAYTNNRGCTKGREGQGLTPMWRAGEGTGGPGPTHHGLGIEGVRDEIHFANAYGSPAHFGGGGRADYIRIERTDGPGSGKYTYRFNVWQNLGSGGAKLKGDGTRHCNMKGHANGNMDLVWIHSTGQMRIYESKGGAFSEAPYWGANYIMFTPPEQIDRRDLHLADWNGDGYCDILHVDHRSGRINVWINKYGQNNNFNSWDYLSSVGPGNLGMPVCPQRGKALTDMGTRFADLDGDGRADVICLWKDGGAFGYLNKASGLEWHPQFKYAEGKDRANLRFADVNGDGRADLLWINKFNGDTQVWQNMGPVPASGSSFTWHNKGVLFQGALQGSCTMYPDLDGNGRVDMTAVDAVTNQATTWFNDCPGNTGGDDTNTHTVRAELPAPPTPEDVALYLAARHGGDAWDDVPEYHAEFGHAGISYDKVEAQVERYRFHNDCNDDSGAEMKPIIIKAWRASWALTDEVRRELYDRNREVLPPGEMNWYSLSSIEYFGNPDYISSSARRTILQGLQRVQDRYGQNLPARGSVKPLFLHCRQWGNHKECSQGTSGNTPRAVVGYVDNEDMTWGDQGERDAVPSITFCGDRLLTAHRIRRITLQDAARVIKQDGLDKRDVGDWDNLGAAFFHEMMHYQSLVFPRAFDLLMMLPDSKLDYAYYPERVKQLAKFVSTELGSVVTHLNADSYTRYALSLAIQYQTDLGTYPNLPAAGDLAAPNRWKNPDPRRYGSAEWLSRRSSNTTDPTPIRFGDRFTLHPNNTVTLHSDPDTWLRPECGCAFHSGGNHTHARDSLKEAHPGLDFPGGIHLRHENFIPYGSYPPDYIAFHSELAEREEKRAAAKRSFKA